MDTNLNKSISKIAYYGCWATILVISIVYLKTTSKPWTFDISGEIFSIETDPLIHIDNRNAIAYIGPPRKFHTIENPMNFHAIPTQQSYHEVYYRPDFEQYPAVTIWILLFRLATYIGIVVLLYLLAGILKSVYKGDPFNPKNHRKLFYNCSIWEASW